MSSSVYGGVCVHRQKRKGRRLEYFTCKRTCQRCKRIDCLAACSSCGVQGSVANVRVHISTAHPRSKPNATACLLTVRNALRADKTLALQIRTLAVSVDDLVGSVCDNAMEKCMERIARARVQFEDRHAPAAGARNSGDALPTELWMKIAEMLDIHDKWALHQTCTRLNAVVSKCTSDDEQFEGILYRRWRAVTGNAAAGPHTHVHPDNVPVLLMEPYLAFVYPTLADVVGYAKSVHKTLANFKRVVQQQQHEARMRNVRERQLQAELEKRGMYIRNDSKMCASFIQHGQGVAGETLSQIVDLMHEMQFLHTHTNYRSILQGMQMQHFNGGGCCSWDMLVEMARDTAVRKFFNSKITGTWVDIPDRIRERANRMGVCVAAYPSSSSAAAL